MPDNAIPIRRALISVHDKTGLAALAAALAARNVEILSTGGSARAIREAGIAVVDVADHTGFPEILGGRVKTLHPLIHGGILARREHPDDRQAMAAHGIAPIDLVVSNLYPFSQTVASGADEDACIENIDIGGPALIRGSAKNHPFVTIVTDPEDYAVVLEEMAHHDGATTLATRRRMAAKAFYHTAAYDAAVASWTASRFDATAGHSDDGDAEQPDAGAELPTRLFLTAGRGRLLRYGENPHQAAAFYRTDGAGSSRPGPATALQIQGKALSYNNLNDTDAAFELVAEFDRPAVAIIKHANPCGVAVADSLVDAWPRALACDPVSAFGGIVAVNRPLDAATASEIAQIFVEVVIAPAVETGAREVLAGKANLRLLETGSMPDPTAPGLALRSIAGGFLVQNRDAGRVAAADLVCRTEREPTEREVADMLFAFAVAKHVKSNAIVYARDGATVGIGAGQMSRVDSARIAVRKAEDAAQAAGLDTPLTQGSVVASDAFFPFADGLLAAADAGVTAVIQPGGSQRDREVVDAANARGLAMVTTGIRHFRH